MLVLRQIRQFLWAGLRIIGMTFILMLSLGTTRSWAATLPTPFLSALPSYPLVAMNRVEAVTKNLEGKAQEAMGNVTGDPQDQIAGKAKQVESQLRNVAEDVKDQAQVRGRAKAIAKNLEGKAQSARGNLTGDPQDQVMGGVKQAESRDRNIVENVKETIQNIFD